jgi:hypothetical protein
MVVAVTAAGVLHELLPKSFMIAEAQLVIYPAFLAVLLGVLVVGDPGRIDRDRPRLQVVTNLMVGLITVVNGVAALRLVDGILTPKAFDSASQLLLIGGVVWLTNIIAFALWFWSLDAGGSAARAATASQSGRAFVFPEMTLTEVVPAGWTPHFVDYLVLAFNTALAFGPTDVVAVRPWAKLMMLTEAMLSLAVVGLVIARAVNIL